MSSLKSSVGTECEYQICIRSKRQVWLSVMLDRLLLFPMKRYIIFNKMSTSYETDQIRILKTEHMFDCCLILKVSFLVITDKEQRYGDTFVLWSVTVSWYVHISKLLIEKGEKEGRKRENEETCSNKHLFEY